MSSRTYHPGAERPGGGRATRLKDVARIELDSRSYGLSCRYKGKDTAILAIYQLPGANALDLADQV